jgi:O-antigen/teichoic acid export membrane protein
VTTPAPSFALHATTRSRGSRLLQPRWAALHGKALELASQLLLVTAIPRLLGPAHYGRLALALTLVTLATVVISLGAPSAFARYLPAVPVEARTAVARAMTLRLLRLRGAQVAAAAAVGAVLTILAPERFPPLDTAFVLGAIVLQLAGLLGAQVALGLGDTWVWSYRVVVQNCALLAAVPLVVAAAGGDAVVAAVLIASSAGALFACSVVARPLWRAEPGASVPDGAFRFGAMAGSGLLLNQLTFRGPVLAAAVLAGSSVLTGYTALAAGVALALLLGLRELFTVSLPELVERWERDRADAERANRRLGWWGLAALAPAALVGAIVLDPVLRALAGERFAGADAALVPTLALLPLLPPLLMGWQAAVLRLRPALAFSLQATGFASFAVAAAILTPLWPAWGAMAALLLAAAVTVSVTAWRLPAAVTARLLAAAFGAAGVVLAVGIVLESR